MSFFNYQTFNASLERSTRTLYVTFTEKSYDRYVISELFLDEIKHLLNWISNKVEVSSIFFSTENKEINQGHDHRVLKNMNHGELQRFTQKLQELTLSMLYLPQTIIFDIGKGVRNIASELSLGADLRIGHFNANLSFEHSSMGLIACSGGLSLLKEIMGVSVARNWILSSNAINALELKQRGYLLQTYGEKDRAELVQEVLNNIAAQAPVQRIQSKLALLHGITSNSDEITKFESQVSAAAMINQDWQKQEGQNYTTAKEMGQKAKLTLLKNPHQEGDLVN